MVVYAGALGCYIALMLLVISMEEGGDNLSAFSVSDVSWTFDKEPRASWMETLGHYMRW